MADATNEEKKNKLEELILRRRQEQEEQLLKERQERKVEDFEDIDFGDDSDEEAGEINGGQDG